MVGAKASNRSKGAGQLMMTTSILIAIAAGSASALMFSSVVSGTLISVALLYLAPLPLLVASIGWGPAVALIGGGAAAAVLAVTIGWSYMLAFVVWAAAPAWWLGHLLMLGRPAENANGPAANSREAAAMEWYPIGRVLLWIAAFAAGITFLALLSIGMDADAINAAIKRSLSRMLGTRAAVTGSADIMTMIAPAIGTAGTMIALTLNVWLAAKIVQTSGRLRRPWPDLRSTAIPPMTMAVLSATIAFCFTGGLLAIVAKIVSGGLVMAYAFAGFATLHTLTLALKSRGVWLGFAYVTTLLLAWPIVLMTVVGLADSVFGLRQRYLQRHSAVPMS